MASTHDSFVKGEMNKAAEHIQKAADYVKKESDKVAKDSKEGVMKAGDQLSAKWSGTKLQDGTQASVDGLKKAEKVTTEEAGKFFKGLGDGIADLGQKLSG